MTEDTFVRCPRCGGILVFLNVPFTEKKDEWKVEHVDVHCAVCGGFVVHFNVKSKSHPLSGRKIY